MTTDLKDVLMELDSKIAEVYDLNLAEEMTDIYVDLVSRVNKLSKKYWELVNALATIEKERDEYYKKFKVEEMISKSKSEDLKLLFKKIQEEREIQDKLEKERDQAEYDRDYYRNELEKLQV